MKSFPDKFPIRYAIVVKEFRGQKDAEDQLDEACSRVLWDQLITLLQNEPLTLDHLNLNYTSLNYSYKNQLLCSIPRLTIEKDWAANAASDLQKHIPEGTFSRGWGSAFSLGLISYGGSGEVPLFWKVYNHADDKKYVGQKVGLYYWGYFGIDKKSAEKIYRQYMRTMDGTDYWDYEHQRSTQKLEILDLRIPYSSLWSKLDAGQNDGHIPNLAEQIEIDNEDPEGKFLKDSPSHIPVTIVKDINSLFKEEMSSLYRVASFCNNCGKPLPFDWQGKYCPLKDNRECDKERARKRHRKSSQV